MSSNNTEENNMTTSLDENLLVSKELPQIEHAQLLSDETIKYNINNEISYSGSLLFICQFGFISDNSENEPFRLTCQNGLFYPKTICIGKQKYFCVKI
jgi:hypothetical protein